MSTFKIVDFSTPISIVKNLAKIEQGNELVISKENLSSILFLLENEKSNISIDKYCDNCKKEKTFLLSVKDSNNLIELFDKFTNGFGMPTITSSKENLGVSNIKDIFELSFFCPECGEMVYMFYLVIGETFHKIFEYPSPIKSKNMQYKKYNSLDKKFNYFLELSTANRLFYESKAYIGAFVYIRRCLENYVISIVNEKIKIGEISKEKSDCAKKFKEKVELIKPFIGIELYETIYPTYHIMSEGIHELSEDECKQMFEILKITVINLLEERVYENEKEKRLKEHKKQILNLHTEQSAKN